MTTSPDGEHVQVHNRLAEIQDRYRMGHPVSRATPLFLEAVVTSAPEPGIPRKGSGGCSQLIPDGA
jgi:hypothetical protein